MIDRIVSACTGARELTRITALAASMLALAGCSSGHADRGAVAAAGLATQTSSAAMFDSAAGIRAPGAGTAAPAPRPTSFDLCRALPPDSITSILRPATGKSVTVATPRPGGMCTYRDVGSDTPDVRVIIDLGRDRSPAAAGVALLERRGQLGARGIATTDISGIGDQAFGSSDSAGHYTITMQDNVVTGQISVSVRGADAESLRPAAVELAKRTLALLH